MGDHLNRFNLYLIRHGETEGNVNRDMYKTKADHAMRLTPRGIEQAKNAGAFLAEQLYREYVRNPAEFGRIRLWHTPYYRGRETAFYMLQELAKKFDPASGIMDYREDSFLFEQKAGVYDGAKDGHYNEVDPIAAADFDKHTLHHGRTYAHTPLGESRMEVVIRVKPHFGTILRDLDTKNIRHVIDVSHGVTLRAEVMSWMHYSPEWLDSEKNPGNCWVRHIHGNSVQGYMDEGYIYGHKAPLHDRNATQIQRAGAEQVFMLKPGRPNGIVPPGIIVVDPFAKSRTP